MPLVGGVTILRLQRLDLYKAIFADPHPEISLKFSQSYDVVAFLGSNQTQI